jgi:rhomboid protease GluP
MREGKIMVQKDDSIKDGLSMNNEQNSQLSMQKGVIMSGKPFLTYCLLFAQIFLFLFIEMFAEGSTSISLIEYGAKVNFYLFTGEWWRFITPIFLHIGYIHIIMNSIALIFIGGITERLFGNIRFLMIYLFSGFAGTLASFVFSPAISAGASGAIFGCLGALLYFGFLHPQLFFRTIGYNILLVIALDLAFGFFVSGIDNAGHIGGLVGGFLAAGVLQLPKQRKRIPQAVFFIVSLALTVGFLYIGYSNQDNQLNIESNIVLAQTYVKEELYDEAYAVLKKMETLEQQTPEILFIRAYVEFEKGMNPQAAKHLHELISRDPKNHKAYYLLAFIYIDQSNLKKAKEYMEIAVELAPQEKEYQLLLQRINHYLVPPQ